MNFYQVSLLLCLAAVGAAIVRAFKQPIIIGYLLAGLILANTGVINLDYSESLSGLGQIGVALLLFLVGLEMNISELPSIGRASIMTGFGQIAFTSILGFLLASALGYGPLVAVYIAIALTFSSTIIIVKLLGEKNDLGSLYGKISVGFLLVQDFFAVLVLMFLAGIRSGDTSAVSMILLFVKGTILLALVWHLSKKVIPNLFEKVLGSSPELLFVGSIAWVLGVASLVGGPLGFTLEVGGFLAGLALANLPEHLEVASRVRPLRDFFLALFFLYLGTTLNLTGSGAVILPAIVFSVFVLVGNPVIVLSIMGFLGYRRRTSFLASVTVAQISEFSLIIMAMGLTLGHVGDSDMSTVVLVGIITMTASTYLILNSEKIFERIKNLLLVFERNSTGEPKLNLTGQYKDHVVLFGIHRTGQVLANYFEKAKMPFVSVDFNPEFHPVVFGDMGDPEILDALSLEKAKLIISTVPTLDDNEKLLEYVRNKKIATKVITSAKTKSDAEVLKKLGADMVVVPEVVAGVYLRGLLKRKLEAKKPL
ncbi:hypothetical protein A3D84_01660 [Candidatus Woesebacteria bacterium RIFCSPHIGHO2_02_FULL_42_20]|uniref:Uncharacterized protein n=1 Tax=Candidatus Woesebacteria bacterium RIFCSPHIGHO2_12_FULL_41_24 TaxID=1802510 RepID=A0A1F8ASC4_9BACT|nr:MAG: hypothetical protein A2W15_05870 [Candidatus Woesebacteria bacterium RBG_16_41_13]OGM30502.1 MAG: hypothetical protein A2873_02655 [Candidatus Woesebacteria bacterium RIFCSPHIGHO2_01_FULL_42_80]OGM35940.1 MAG: hypothetical protein A3D84_01660 [Candidatus Woesebacteria bacterium RIFCSPHIGHO2_02_FULL_42_20]OGM54168.1 MAG: hypothetical protein A3E44_00600 [Candidatus Woesebacteria bacterium RIFCSPHIGHO2_12_FULL_41_24]OGM66504.1 MAG: hypothetical protein A2969_02635 [Candidatus Woesebacteri